MSTFIEWLEDLNKRSSKVRAVLRRSLAFEPGTFPSAYPYIEPFVKDEGNSWRREMHYLVAGLWAEHWRDGSRGHPLTFGAACSAQWQASGSASTEQRFISLLDSDQDQLPHRLRQMVALLKGQPIDFDALLRNLLYWRDDQKRTQNAWARDFYRNTDGQSVTEDQTETEISE